MARIPSLFFAIVLPFAAAKDPLFSKIPNWLTYPTMIVGVLYSTHLKGLDGILRHVAGIGTGLAMPLGAFTRSAARSPAFEGGGRRARLRVDLEQTPASCLERSRRVRSGSREVHFHPAGYGMEPVTTKQMEAHHGKI